MAIERVLAKAECLAIGSDQVSTDHIGLAPRQADIRGQATVPRTDLEFEIVGLAR